MRFQTQRPASWQTCIACGNEVVETDPHPRCGLCGGLLEIHHRPPAITAQELIQRFTERRGARREQPRPACGGFARSCCRRQKQ